MVGLGRKLESRLQVRYGIREITAVHQGHRDVVVVVGRLEYGASTFLQFLLASLDSRLGACLDFRFLWKVGNDLVEGLDGFPVILCIHELYASLKSGYST